MTITKTVRLVAAPTPTFVGTVIEIYIPWTKDGTLDFGIFSITRSATGTLDWGDGTTLEGTRFSRAVHTYAAPGKYRIKIAAGITNMVLTYINSSDNYSEKYGPSVLSFTSNDPDFPLVGAYGFAGCRNMTTFDVRETKISRLLGGEWQGCASLTGELYFPCVDTLQAQKGIMPFAGCTGGITAIHLPKANEASLIASEVYQTDPTLGTGTAQCIFDL